MPTGASEGTRVYKRYTTHDKTVPQNTAKIKQLENTTIQVGKIKINFK
jgi:hypothetical protein